MSTEQSAGDTGRPDAPAGSEAAIGKDTDAAARAPAEAGTVGAATAAARSSPKPAPDGNRRRGRGDLRRSRRRRSFDDALGGIARRSGLRPSRTGGGGGSGGFAATTEQHRERSSSCLSYFASGSVLVSALVTARPGGDGGGDDADGHGDGDGAGRAAKTSVGNAAPSRQEWTISRFNNRKEALTVSSDVSVAAAAAAAESHGVGSTTAAGLAGEASASGGVGEAAADVGSTKSTETNADRRKLPLPLEPLAGRCWFEDCGKISSFRCRRCRLAFYCGRDHQRDHWARHRGSCEGGRGEPPPPLARLALPPQRQKSVGWADSTTPRSADGGGVRGRVGGGGGVVASAAFRRKKSRLEAAMASAHSKGAAPGTADGSSGSCSFDPSQVRTAREGASWTVPTSSNGGGGGGGGAGSAAVWPASSSWAGGAGGGGGVTGTRQRAGLAPQVPPSGSPPPPPGPPPPAKIPPPASRPLLDKLPKATPATATATATAAAAFAGPEHASSAEVDMLTEMGFDRSRAVQALQTCGGSVERAAEWLLTGFGGGGDGDGIAHGPHLPGAGSGGQDGDGGGRGWLGGGTEMEAVGKSGSGGGGGGGENNDDDDLITTADASDVGQGLDMREFWSSETAGRGGGGGDGAWATDGKSGWGTGAGGGSMTAVEEDDDEDFVTCYEDTVGGVQADVVIFFRSADSAAGASAPTSSQGDSEEAAGGAAGGEQGEGAVLTVVVRPLPSTAPASVDSGSSRGDYDRHDTGHDIEHALSLPWAHAEDLARRRETAQALRAASSTAVAAAAAAVGIGSDELAGPGGGGDAWRQGGGGAGRIFGGDLPPPLSPSSPLRPTSRSYDDGAGGSPSWGRKKKVGELIVGIMERRLDGGYDVFAPEVDRASRLHASGAGLSQADVVARTYERPRGRSLPKWDDRANATVKGPPPPAASALAWGSIGGGLTQQHKQPWNCQVCTFFNEDPAFRSACEMCSTPRPSTIADLGGANHQEWDERGDVPATAATVAACLREGMGGSAVPSSEGVRLAPIVGASPMAPATASLGVMYGGGVNGGVADGHDDDDDGAVDGILGGLSPGGGAYPTASATGVPMAVPYVAVRKGAAQTGDGGAGNAGGIDWEQGEEWEGVGNASFGDDSPVVGSPQHAAFGFPLGGGGHGGDGVGDGGGRGSEGHAP